MRQPVPSLYLDVQARLDSYTPLAAGSIDDAATVLGPLRQCIDDRLLAVQNGVRMAVRNRLSSFPADAEDRGYGELDHVHSEHVRLLTEPLKLHDALAYFFLSAVGYAEKMGGFKDGVYESEEAQAQIRYAAAGMKSVVGVFDRNLRNSQAIKDPLSKGPIFSEAEAMLAGGVAHRIEKLFVGYFQRAFPEAERDHSFPLLLSSFSRSEPLVENPRPTYVPSTPVALLAEHALSR